MLLERDGAEHAVLGEAVGVDHVARHVVVGVAAAEIEVGRRQHRERDAGIGHAPGHLVDVGLAASMRELADMADRDAAAPAVFLGEIADQQRVELLGRGAAVEMHVDVDIELARHLEDAADLRRPVGVVVRRRADDGRAVLQRRDHQLVGAGIVGQSLLRHDADLEVDRPA